MNAETQKSLDTLRESFKSEIKNDNHKAVADVLFNLAEVIIGSLESIDKSLATIAANLSTTN